MRMPRVIPFWMKFWLTSRPLTPPPITSCDPNELVIVFPVTEPVTVNAASPW